MFIIKGETINILCPITVHNLKMTHTIKAILEVVIFAVSALALDIHIYNRCNGSRWPAITGVGLNRNSPIDLPMPPRLLQGETYDLTVAEPWAGRVWTRSGCNETGCNCTVGDCGQSNCNGLSSKNVTLVEFTIQNRTIFYDISIGKLALFNEDCMC